MGFSLDISIPVLTVFVQGILSFFSPCVLPLLPLYIGYLSGGTGKRGEDGKMYYDRKKVMVHTLWFVLGVSFAFFVLGLGVSALGQFFKGNQTMFARIGGVFVLLIGLYQLGIFGTSEALSKEHRLPVSLNMLAMSPVTAFVLGFTFSFAWTPCVGPALASVLLMAASAATQAKGFLLIGVYTIGFVLPFLAVGLFTTAVLDFFKKHGNVVAYTTKIGAVLMIFMGVMMFTGKMNSITGYLSEISLPGTEKSGEAQTESEAVEPENAQTESGDGAAEPENAVPEAETAAVESETARAEAETAAVESEAVEQESETATEETESVADKKTIPALDFTLTDQYGNSHTLSDYKGKTVFLNFWATWCPPCRREMPEIQMLYEEYSAEEDPSVIILGIAAPEYGNEESVEGISAFLEENSYTYPVLMDEGGTVFMDYGVYSYPTTFMIDKDGNVFGYATGQLSESMMRSIIDQTVTGVRVQ